MNTENFCHEYAKYIRLKAEYACGDYISVEPLKESLAKLERYTREYRVALKEPETIVEKQITGGILKMFKKGGPLIVYRDDGNTYLYKDGVEPEGDGLLLSEIKEEIEDTIVLEDGRVVIQGETKFYIYYKKDGEYSEMRSFEHLGMSREFVFIPGDRVLDFRAFGAVVSKYDSNVVREDLGKDELTDFGGNFGKSAYSPKKNSIAVTTTTGIGVFSTNNVENKLDVKIIEKEKSFEYTNVNFISEDTFVYGKSIKDGYSIVFANIDGSKNEQIITDLPESHNIKGIKFSPLNDAIIFSDTTNVYYCKVSKNFEISKPVKIENTSGENTCIYNFVNNGNSVIAISSTTSYINTLSSEGSINSRSIEGVKLGTAFLHSHDGVLTIFNKDDEVWVAAGDDIENARLLPAVKRVISFINDVVVALDNNGNYRKIKIEKEIVKK